MFSLISGVANRVPPDVVIQVLGEPPLREDIEHMDKEVCVFALCY